MSKLSKLVLWIIITLLAIGLLLTVGVLGYLLFGNVNDSLKVELGEEFSAADFLRTETNAEIYFATDLSQVDLMTPGEKDVEIVYCGRIFDSKLILVDTTCPSVVTRDMQAFYTQIPEPEDFIESIIDYSPATVAYAKEPDASAEGIQTVSLLVTDTCGNTTQCSAELKLIMDRVAPEIQGVLNRTMYLGLPVDLMEGISVTDDLDPAPALVMDDTQVDMERDGEYMVTYTATDACGNSTIATATLTVINDTLPPVIYGVNKLSIYQGSTVSYRSGVIVTDDYDSAPMLSIDSSAVNLNEPGTYDVIYSATDAAGNTASVSTTITIREKKSNYVDEAEIYAMADALLAKFITDDMTPEEQVRAVYKWVRNNFRYANSYDKVDRLQGAYHMMSTGGGDCYNFYAICSVFFERLGIPQISVVRSSNSGRGTKHFWSMVSLDGGETYYHFDSCPTTFFSANTCLLTDAGLQKINRIAPGYFAMDPGIYPKTPDKELS